MSRSKGAAHDYQEVMSKWCQTQEKVAIELLETLPGVDKVIAIQNAVFHMACKDAEAVKKQLLQLSIEKNLNIVSLQSEAQSLENVFRQLTTN